MSMSIYHDIKSHIDLTAAQISNLVDHGLLLPISEIYYHLERPDFLESFRIWFEAAYGPLSPLYEIELARLRDEGQKEKESRQLRERHRRDAERDLWKMEQCDAVNRYNQVRRKVELAGETEDKESLLEELRRLGRRLEQQFQEEEADGDFLALDEDSSVWEYRVERAYEDEEDEDELPFSTLGVSLRDEAEDEQDEEEDEDDYSDTTGAECCGESREDMIVTFVKEVFSKEGQMPPSMIWDKRLTNSDP